MANGRDPRRPQVIEISPNQQNIANCTSASYPLKNAVEATSHTACDLAALSGASLARRPAMNIHRRTLGLILGVLAVLAVIVILSLTIGREYACTQTAKRTFTIDEDFTNVRKILVRTNASQQIVTMGGDSEFISQNLTPTSVGAGNLTDELLNPDWHIELHGTLRVRTKDPYIGRQILDLSQDVEIKPDYLDSKTHLGEPAGRLKIYGMKTRFFRDEETGKSNVELELTQQILTDAPWFAHGIADRRVRASVEKTLANQETAIRKLIDENKDKIPIFPLR
jgi:hypothetical protein